MRCGLELYLTIFPGFAVAALGLILVTITKTQRRYWWLYGAVVFLGFFIGLVHLMQVHASSN